MAAKKNSKTKTDARKNRPRVPGSMAERIDSLKVGESVSESERFEFDEHNLSDNMLEAGKKMRNNLAAYVARIRDELDTREFIVESGAYVVESKKAIIVNATVTRTE
jgi:hypothetical protein